ncbi:MAG: flagellar biosynthetic protein FliR [Planctomycetes bacterium]|nr:flagellar biosynthetic protein FliR [Planctomycetota bacterium]
MTLDLPLEPIVRVVLAALRAGMVLLLLPIGGGEGVPAPLRVILSLVLGGLLVGMPTGTMPASADGLLLAAGRELLLGLGIGFLVRVLLAAPALAGDMVAQEIGLKMSEEIDPTTRVPATAPAKIYETALLLLFLCSHGHHDVIRALHASFASFPVGGHALPEGMALMTGALADCLRFAVMIAAPMLAVLLVGSLSLALLSRAVPELHVMTFGYPLRLVGALAAAIVLFPFVLTPGLGLISVLRGSLLRLVGG